MAAPNQPLSPLVENESLNLSKEAANTSVDTNKVYGTFQNEELAQSQLQQQIKQDENGQVEANQVEPKPSLFDTWITPYIGETWFNIALIFLACFITLVFSYFRLTILVPLILGYFIANLFNSSIEATYKRKIIKIQEKMMLPQLENDIESGLWLNGFLSRFWYQFEPKLSKQLVDSVESIIEPYLPSIIKSVKFEHFTLGNKPPIIKGVKYYPSHYSDTIIMDWHVSFYPNSFYELKLNQLAKPEVEDIAKIDSNIILGIQFQIGPIKFNIPIKSNGFHLNAKLRVKLKLMNQFPHIKGAHVSLLEQPEIDFSLIPIYGIDITNIPGFKTLFNRQVHQIIDPMILAPNIYNVDLESMLGDSGELESAIGILKLSINNAMGLKNVELIGVIDPFVSINIQDRKELFRTKTMDNTTSPVWEETFTLLIYNLNETLNMVIKDENGVKKDRILGVTSLQLNSLLEEPMQNNCDKIIRNGKDRGNLTYTASYYPVAEAIKLDDGSEEIIQSNSGIVKIFIREVQGLEQQKRLLPVGGKTKIWINILFNGYPAHKTNSFNIMNHIVMESVFEKFIEDINIQSINIVLMASNNSKLGQINMSLNQFLEEAKNDSWFNFDTGSLDKDKSIIKTKLTGKWSPILMDASSHGVLPPSFGFVRVKVLRAKEIKVKEIHAKSTMSVNVTMSNKVWGRTEQTDLSPNPNWDETFYVPIHQIKEVLKLEVVGSGALRENKVFGNVELKVKDLVGNALNDLNGFEDGELKVEWYNLIHKGQKRDSSIELMMQYFSLPSQFLQPKVDSKSNLNTRTNTLADQQSIKSKKSSNSVSPNRSSIQINNSSIDHNEISEEPLSKDTASSINYSEFKSGILRVKLHEAKDIQTKHKIYALTTLNGNFRSPVLRTLVKKNTPSTSWGEVGEGFVKEISVDILNLEIKTSKEGEDKTIGSFNKKIKEILELMKINKENEKEGYWFNLDTVGSIRLSFEFTPSNYTIDESESARNMGILQIKVIKATNLIPADKDGSSDPYIALSLNGNKKLKTKTKKNNLNPNFDEIFNFEVSDRIKSILRIEAFDWNQIQSHSSLGHYDLELKLIEAEVKDEVTFDLLNVKHGNITLELFFAPYYVLRDVNPSLITAALSGNPVDLVGGLAKGGFKVATGGLSMALGGAAHLAEGTSKLAIGGAKTVLSAPLKIASNSKSFAKGIFHSIKDTITHNEDHDHPNTPQVTLNDNNIDDQDNLIKLKNNNLNSSSHSISSTISGSFGRSTAVSRSPSRQDNNLESAYSVKITLLDAKDLIAADRNGYSDPYIKVMKEKKVIYKTKVQKKTRNPHWDESFSLSPIYPGETYILNLIVKDYNFIKENVELGSYSLNIWHHFEDPVSNDGNKSVDFWTAPGELKNGGVGQIKIKLELISPKSNSNNESPTSISPHYSNEQQHSDDHEEEAIITDKKLKRNSMSSLKPKNLFGSLRSKMGKN